MARVRVRSHYRRRPAGHRRHRRYGGRVAWVPIVIAILVIAVLIAVF